MPKILAKGRLRELLDHLPIMQLFVRHLVSIDGGKWRDEMTVGRMWYKLESKPSNPCLLLDPIALDKLKLTVFEGKHLLKEPKMPQTLQKYVSSFKLFYNCVIAQRDIISSVLEITTKDMEEITSATKHVEHWSSRGYGCKEAPKKDKGP